MIVAADILAAARAEIDLIIRVEARRLVDELFARGLPPDEVRAAALRFVPPLARVRGEARRRLDALEVQAERTLCLRDLAQPKRLN